MRRLIIVLVMLWSLVLTVSAQDMPVIETFTVATDGLNYAQVEGGTAAADFSWRVTGLRSGDVLQMHAWVNGTWSVIGTGFEPVKTDTLVIAHPLSFELPRYRLSVVDANGVRVAESILELPYAPHTGETQINYFLTRTSMPEITVSEVQSETFVPVHWRITNRPYRSNLEFLQIMPNGSQISLAPPRPDEWMRAVGEGFLVPRDPGPDQDVRLRLHLFNIDTGATIATEDYLLPVVDVEVPEVEVLEFTASPQVGTPGGEVTLTWNVPNARRIYIAEAVLYTPGCKHGIPPSQVYEDLPASGTLTVAVPDYPIGPIRYQLVADRYRLPEFGCEPMDVVDELRYELDHYYQYTSDDFTFLRISIPPDWTATDPISLEWETAGGESISVSYGYGPSRYDYGFDPDENPTEATFSDLPGAGTLSIQVDDPLLAQEAAFVWLEIRRAGSSDVIWDTNIVVLSD